MISYRAPGCTNWVGKNSNIITVVIITVMLL